MPVEKLKIQLQSLEDKKNEDRKRYKRMSYKQPFEATFEEYDAVNIELYDKHVDKMKSRLKS